MTYIWRVKCSRVHTSSTCFCSVSSCRWVIHQSVTPKAFVSPSSSTLTSFHPSLSDSLLSSLPLSLSLCHLSYPNVIRIRFPAVRCPSNTSGPFHYIFPAQNELRSGKSSEHLMSMFICLKKLLPQPNSNESIHHSLEIKKGRLGTLCTLQFAHCPSTLLLGLHF